MSAKWGVFGRSFNDIGNAVTNKLIDFNDEFERTGKLFSSWNNTESIFDRLYPTKANIDSMKIEVPELIDTNKANEYLNIIKQIDSGTHNQFKTFQEWHDELANGEKWISKYAQASKGQIRSLEGISDANKEAHDTALTHNQALKQQTLGAKAASVAMSLLSTAMNALISIAITKLITAWDDYKDKLRETAEEMSEVAEESANHAQSLLELQRQLDDDTVSAEDLTTAFREQMRAMGYTETQIDSLIGKYGNLAGAINEATEEALNNAKTDAYADMSTSGKSLTAEAKGNTNVSFNYTQNKELSDEIAKMLADSPAILDGGVFRMNKNASAEEIYEYYLTLKDISRLIQETAEETGDDSLIAGDMFNPTPYYQVSEALDALSESAELYGDAIDRLHSTDAQLELSNYLKTNDIDSKEAFDKYVDGIKNSETYSESYKQVLLEVANDAFPQFSASAKDASDTLDDFANKTGNLSFTEQISQVQSLSKGLDQLAKVYKDVQDGGDFDWSSILNNADFKDTFKDCTETYDEFIFFLYDKNIILQGGRMKIEKAITQELVRQKLLKKVESEKQTYIANQIGMPKQVLSAFKLGKKELWDEHLIALNEYLDNH